MNRYFSHDDIESMLKVELRDNVTVSMRIDNRTHASDIEQHVSDFSPSWQILLLSSPSSFLVKDVEVKWFCGAR